MAFIFFIFTLIVCNVTFVTTAGWSRVVWELFGFACLLTTCRLANFTLDDIGLKPANIKTGLRYAGLVIAIIAAGALLIFFVDRQFFKDPRYHHTLSVALYASLVLLPLKTVLFEEISFRGIFPAFILRFKKSRWTATLLSSLAYGIWHVSSARAIGSYNIGDHIIVPKTLVIMVALLATTLAGIVLTELRWRSKSLVAPIVVHWFINGFAIILAALAWR